MENISGLENPVNIEPATSVKKKNHLLIIIIVSVLIIIIAAGLYWFYIQQSKTFSQTSKTSTKFCDGVNIVFFPGGSQTDTFASIVYNGAKAAENILGANVSYIWSDWDSNKMVSQFIDVISSPPDAIAIMGHPGASALSPLIDEAERKNIIVTMQNVDIPSIREKYISNGFGYAGQNVYGSGLQLATGAIRKYNLKKDDEALVLGIFSQSAATAERARRTQGIVDGLKQIGAIVHTVDVPPEVQADYNSDVSYKWFVTQINTYPNSKVLFVDNHGSVTPSFAKHLKTMGKKPNELPYAGFDLSADTIKYIKEGYISLISDQQPYLQGFLPILQSCLTKKYKFAGLYVDTGVGLVDSSNVDFVSDLVDQGIR